MGSDGYSAAVGGGLKLKGAKPAGLTKRRKKDKSKSKAKEDKIASALHDALADEERATAADESLAGGDREGREGQDDGEGDGGEGTEDVPVGGKTEAERNYEDMRRKRLDERLRKEGVKTHKQRVEELNKYLSTLSEHHDMPRIGPG